LEARASALRWRRRRTERETIAPRIVTNKARITGRVSARICNPTAVDEGKGGQLTRKNVYCAKRFSVVSVSGEHGTEWDGTNGRQIREANCQIL
jgi:hypothetical protein